MKLIPVLCLLMVVVAGCGQIGGSKTTNSTNNSMSNRTSESPAQPKIAKIFDMPSLLGKSSDEIGKVLNQRPAKEDTTSTFYDLPEGTLQVGYDKGRQTIISFESKVKNESSLKMPGFRFAEELGNAVGIDIKGEPLTIGNDDEYKGFEINGKKCDLKVKKLAGSYGSISIYCP